MDELRKRKMSMYRLSKLSRVPYATIHDICDGKAKLEKCSAETVYQIAQALELPMEELLLPCLLKRSSFENFKSAVCQRVKDLGDTAFIIDTLEHQEIKTYFKRKWYPECLYLLAMLDYICRENGIPICDEYDEIRQCRLEKPVYPASLLALSAASRDDTILKESERKAIPEFIRFNIVENEVRDVA